MNDANYDDWNDFYGEKNKNKKKKKIKQAKKISNFAEKVIFYLECEWEIRVVDYPTAIQDKVLAAIDAANGENVANTASKISMEVIPI